MSQYNNPISLKTCAYNVNIHCIACWRVLKMPFFFWTHIRQRALRPCMASTAPIRRMKLEARGGGEWDWSGRMRCWRPSDNVCCVNSSDYCSVNRYDDWSVSQMHATGQAVGHLVVSWSANNWQTERYRDRANKSKIVSLVTSPVVRLTGLFRLDNHRDVFNQLLDTASLGSNTTRSQPETQTPISTRYRQCYVFWSTTRTILSSSP